jgi:hypothetical protein
MLYNVRNNLRYKIQSYFFWLNVPKAEFWNDHSSSWHIYKHGAQLLTKDQLPNIKNSNMVQEQSVSQKADFTSSIVNQQWNKWFNQLKMEQWRHLHPGGVNTCKQKSISFP